MLPPIQSNTLKYEYIILPQGEKTTFRLTTKSGASLITKNGRHLGFSVITEDNMKVNLARFLEKQLPSYFYDRLIELDADNYVTTNYELFLPQKYSMEIRQLKNSLIYRCRSLKNDNRLVTFWNIHGDTEDAKKIILGLSDYCRYVADIDEYLNRSEKGCLQSWIDLIFNTEVHILGLAMGYEEIDLWNVLTTRKRKRRRKTSECQNEIYYYAIHDESFDPGKKELLNALDVNVIDIEFDGNQDAYKNAYEKIYRMIKTKNAEVGLKR